MELQVLVSTMHQKDYKLLDEMNIQSDTIIINQTDVNSYEEFFYHGNKIRFFSFTERGIGLSRNNALMRATAEISLFADDDVVYKDNYKQLICDVFNRLQDADIIIFNVPSMNSKRSYSSTTKTTRVRWFNCLKYGAVRMAVKTESVKKANVFFSLLFGGGAKYSAGEDSLFIFDCIKKGLKVYSVPIEIGKVKQEKSTWFEGYTDKYFIDKGVFFATLSKKWAYLLCIQFVLRHRQLFKESKNSKEALKLMFSGIKQVKYSNLNY